MASLRTMIGDASARRFFLLVILAVVCAFTGGSFRPTAPTLLVLRPVLVVAFVALATLPATYDWRGLRTPSMLLVTFALTMVLQLVPIPSSWWLGLVGHARYAPALQASGVSALPLSLVPDLTLNSLLSLLPAACVVLAYGGMRLEHRWATLWIAIGLAGISVVMGLMQLGGPSGIGYIYGARQDYVGGILANRNHQAVLLGSTLPLLAIAARFVVYRREPVIAIVALAGLGMVIVPVILLTGSRQGLLLVLPAIVVAILVAPRPEGRLFGRFAISGRWIAIGLIGIAVILVGLAIATGRAVSIERLVAANAVSDDARWRNLPTVIAITRDMLPWGTGYGTFDPVYRGFEPDALLHASYFNHAHNDLLETLMTGGLPAGVLIILLAVHIIWRLMRMVGRDAPSSRDSLFLDRAASVVAILFLAASLIDYPLRTSIGSMVFALAVCWFSAPPALPARGEKRRGRRTTSSDAAALHSGAIGA